MKKFFDFKKTKLLFFVLIVLFILTACSKNNGSPYATPDLDDNPDKVVIYFFWGEGCPHCETQKPFLKLMEERYSQVEVKSFETWKNPANAQIFGKIAEAYGFRASGVPTTFIGDEYFVGFGGASTTGKMIEDNILFCIEYGCENPGDKVLSK